MKVKLKAACCYGKTESPRGHWFGIGTCLNPDCKLNLFREWDLIASGETDYGKSYKKEFLAYYDLYYASINIQAPDMSIPQCCLNSRSKHLYPSRHRAVILCETLVYLKTNCNIEPPKPDGQVTDPTCQAWPAGISYKANKLEGWKVSGGRFPNVSPMARDILSVQGGSVGVEPVFSMARDVIPYRRSQLQSSTIRSSMLVKSYESGEL